MSANSRGIAIDVGNTSTRLGIVDPHALTCAHQISFATAALQQRLPDALASLSGHTEPGLPVTVCSVVKSSSDCIERLAASLNRGVRWVAFRSDLPVTLAYADPGALGADRLANALYCCRAFAGMNVVVVDVGTAVKVDLVEGGSHFAGGTILPGIAAQLASLHASTAALPLLETALVDSFFPGRSTTDCMQAGVLYGIAGAVGRIVADLGRMKGGDAIVVATGGGWPLLEPLVDFKFRHIPDMTLVGTGLFGSMCP
jgi:type III pantothenate kinase